MSEQWETVGVDALEQGDHVEVTIAGPVEFATSDLIYVGDAEVPARHIASLRRRTMHPDLPEPGSLVRIEYKRRAKQGGGVVAVNGIVTAEGVATNDGLIGPLTVTRILRVLALPNGSTPWQ